ncbi:Putative mutator sub-class protein [Arachis hypogaea]|nr:Putative mutator sub-class protein [Arachis hypogaea]
MCQAIIFCIPISLRQGYVKFGKYEMLGDDDMRVIFHSQTRFSDLGAMELFARMVDVDGSSGRSALNPPTSIIKGNDLGDGRSLGQLAVAMGAALAVDSAPTFMEIREIDPFAEAIGNDGSDSEPPIISDESDGKEDTTRVGGAQTHASSQTQQYPRHFFTLYLNAMNQTAFVDQQHPTIHEDRPSMIGTDEFGIGQQFKTKDEAMLTIRVIIFVVRKGYWEVKKYNGPHTCLATEISTNHRQLDYHVICASVLSLVMADASVFVKVLQNAVSSKFGFKPSYRKVWMAKQKAVAQIYGDWEESYNHIPRWIIGVQLYMLGTIAVLRTSPVKAGNMVDGMKVFFHRLFWTFSPCIETFKYCKPLISIDDTHLYGKYRGILLMAIAQDGNSNILPVAFGLVEGKNTDSWKFFLSHLRHHVTPQAGILVISDHHNAIKAALLAKDSG